eukprot:RCo046408
MNGYLTVRRTAGHQRFYFVLDAKAGTMTCWREPNSGYVGTSNLQGGSVCAGDDGEGKRFTLTSKHGRKLLLRADTAAECTEWIRAISDIQAAAGLGKPPSRPHDDGEVGHHRSHRPTETAVRQPLRPTSVPAFRANARPAVERAPAPSFPSKPVT